MRSSHFVIGLLIIVNLISLIGSRFVSYHIQQKYVGKINELPIEQAYRLVGDFTKEYKPVREWDLPDFGPEKISSELTSAVSLFPKSDEGLFAELERIDAYWKREDVIAGIKSASSCFGQERDFNSAYPKYSLMKCLESFPLQDWAEKFFMLPPLISPVGGSFVWQVWMVQSEAFNRLDPSLKQRLIHVTHFYERYQMPWSESLLAKNFVSLLGVADYQQMMQVNPLLMGRSQVFVLKYGQKQNSYMEFTTQQWQAHQNNYPQNIASFADDRICEVKILEFCWVKNQAFYSRLETLVMMRDVWPLVIALMSLILFLIYFIALRIRIESHQRLMIGALTHEVRHPIFSIQLSADLLRKEIDHLTSSGQEELMRILDQLLKMKKVLKASQVYLKSFFSSGEEFTFQAEEIHSVNDFLANLVEEIQLEYEVLIDFQELSQDCKIHADSYWLGMCISNLMTNAVKYGQSGVMLRAEVKKRTIQFVVQDQGERLNQMKNLRDVLALSQGNMRSFEAGMGLGLSLIARIIQRMGGKFYFKPLPTRFIVELECVYEKEYPTS